jgi:hypothetical protein
MFDSDKESSDNNKSVIVDVVSKGNINSAETKSDDGSKTVNFSQKINNNNLTKISTPATYEKKSVIVGGELNNGSEVKLVKESAVIMKPTTKPPPPPIAKSRESDNKSSLITSNDNANDSSAAQPKWSVGKKKSWSSQTTDEPKNSIVFNFCDRKDVPDYIDNDGLIIRRKRELPKVSYT